MEAKSCNPISCKTLDVSNGSEFCQANESSFNMASKPWPIKSLAIPTKFTLHQVTPSSSCNPSNSKHLTFQQITSHITPGDLILLPALGAKPARRCLALQQSSQTGRQLSLCGEWNILLEYVAIYHHLCHIYMAIGKYLQN